MIRIGLVGLGGMGTVHHSNYACLKDCAIVAAVGQTEQDKQKAKEWGIPLYSSISEMAAAEKMELIDVCTPTFLHKAHVLEAIFCGKHVIVEKPIALTKRDAEEMFHAAEKKGVLLFVGQVLRFHRESQILAELMQSGEYGKVLDATFERLSACPRWAQGGWLLDKEKSGQIPFDLHIHDLDLIVSLFGKPEVFRFTCCGREGLDYKEQYRFFYQFGDLHVVAEAAWFNADIPFTARWRVCFENAVVINDGKTLTAYGAGTEPRVFDTEEKTKIPTGINLPPTGVFLEELGHFLQCVREGRPSERITKEQVLEVISMLESYIR